MTKNKARQVLENSNQYSANKVYKAKVKQLNMDLKSGDYDERMRELQNQSAESAFEREQTSANQAMAFSSDEAQKNRDWQTELSNTAHQREMSDYSAAGLNPILAATGGAAMGGGAVGQSSSASGHQASVNTDSKLLRILDRNAQLWSSAVNSATRVATSAIGKI